MLRDDEFGMYFRHVLELMKTHEEGEQPEVPTMIMNDITLYNLRRWTTLLHMPEYKHLCQNPAVSTELKTILHSPSEEASTPVIMIIIMDTHNI